MRIGEDREMRENPSKGYIAWALSRFGPEWVEAHLSVHNESESSPVDVRRTVAKPKSSVKRMPVARPERRKKVILTAFHPSASPSLN